MIIDPSTKQTWQQTWLNLLTESQLPADSTRLRQRTKGLRVRQLEITPGVISAKVRNQDGGLCEVTIELPILNDTQWANVLDCLAAHGSDQIFTDQSRAGFASTLLKADNTLLPSSLGEFNFDCNCCTPDDSLCPPVLTAYLAVTEMIAEDPWLLLRLRGRDRQQLLEEYGQLQDVARTQMSKSSHGGQASYVYRAGGSTQMDDTPPLSESLDHFWGHSRQQLNFQHHITSPQIDLVLLRRLGPPPFSESSFDLYEYLTDVYHRVTAAALALAYQPDDDLLADEND